MIEVDFSGTPWLFSFRRFCWGGEEREREREREREDGACAGCDRHHGVRGERVCGYLVLRGEDWGEGGVGITKHHNEAVSQS